MNSAFLLPFLFALGLPLNSTAAIAIPAATIPVIRHQATPGHPALEDATDRQLTLRERTAAKRLVRRAKRQNQQTPSTNGMAVAGFVCSVVGLFFFGITLGPLGIVFSAIGLSRANKEGRPRRGLARAGLIIGIVTTVGWSILIIAAAASI